MANQSGFTRREFFNYLFRRTSQFSDVSQQELRDQEKYGITRRRFMSGLGVGIGGLLFDFEWGDIENALNWLKNLKEPDVMKKHGLIEKSSEFIYSIAPNNEKLTVRPRRFRDLRAIERDIQEMKEIGEKEIDNLFKGCRSRYYDKFNVSCEGRRLKKELGEAFDKLMVERKKQNFLGNLMSGFNQKIEERKSNQAKWNKYLQEYESQLKTERDELLKGAALTDEVLKKMWDVDKYARYILGHKYTQWSIINDYQTYRNKILKKKLFKYIKESKIVKYVGRKISELDESHKRQGLVHKILKKRNGRWNIRGYWRELKAYNKARSKSKDASKSDYKVKKEIDEEIRSIFEKEAKRKVKGPSDSELESALKEKDKKVGDEIDGEIARSMQGEGLKPVSFKEYKEAIKRFRKKEGFSELTMSEALINFRCDMHKYHKGILAVVATSCKFINENEEKLERLYEKDNKAKIADRCYFAEMDSRLGKQYDKLVFYNKNQRRYVKELRAIKKTISNSLKELEDYKIRRNKEIEITNKRISKRVEDIAVYKEDKLVGQFLLNAYSKYVDNFNLEYGTFSRNSFINTYKDKDGHLKAEISDDLSRNLERGVTLKGGVRMWFREVNKYNIVSRAHK